MTQNSRPLTRYERWLTPSIEVLVFVLLFWESLFFMPQMLNADGDLARHLTVGNHILTTGQIPVRDLFSHTRADAPVILHEWLSQVFFAMAYRGAGLNGVAWLTAFVIAATYAALAHGLRDSGVGALVAFGGALAASIVGSLHLLPRPHLFTIFFFTLYLLLLERYRHDGAGRVLWLLPPLMLVWVNLHGGGLLFGLLLIGLYGVGTLLEKKIACLIALGATGMAVLLASAINPAGPGLLTHMLGFLGQGNFILDITTEYQSPNFHALNALPFLALVSLSIALGWRARQMLGWTELVLLLAWTAFALYTARNIPLYTLVAILVLAPTVQARLDETLPPLPRALASSGKIAPQASGWVWAAVVAIVLIALQAGGARLDPGRKGNTFDASSFPMAAVDALKENLPDGNMFNEFNWGGYLSFRLFPQKKVFIDGFTDFYGEALTRKYLQVINGEAGWEKVLAEYDARWVIIPPTRPLAERLENSANWAARYKDDTAAVWVRAK